MGFPNKLSEVNVSRVEFLTLEPISFYLYIQKILLTDFVSVCFNELVFSLISSDGNTNKFDSIDRNSTCEAFTSEILWEMPNIL